MKKLLVAAALALTIVIADSACNAAPYPTGTTVHYPAGDTGGSPTQYEREG